MVPMYGNVQTCSVHVMWQNLRAVSKDERSCLLLYPKFLSCGDKKLEVVHLILFFHYSIQEFARDYGWGDLPDQAPSLFRALLDLQKCENLFKIDEAWWLVNRLRRLDCGNDNQPDSSRKPH